MSTAEIKVGQVWRDDRLPLNRRCPYIRISSKGSTDMFGALMLSSPDEKGRPRKSKLMARRTILRDFTLISELRS